MIVRQRHMALGIACILLFTCVNVLGFSTRKPPFLLYHITGLDDHNHAQKNVISALDNDLKTIDQPGTDDDAKQFCLLAPATAKTAIQPFGYFESTVTCALEKRKGTWLAIINVKLDEPILIQHAHIKIQGDGKTDKKFIALINNMPLHVHDVLHTKKYDDAKTDLFNIATTRGYFDAKLVTHILEINLITHRATIDLVFDTGPRYRFGETTFSKTPFYDHFLKRFLYYHAGDYYNGKILEKTQAGLARSNYFKQVIAKPDLKAAKNHVVPVHISLIVRKKREYTAGVGYGTDTGARVTLGATWRRLGGSGHRIQTLLRASQDNNSFVTKYMIPGPNPAEDLLTLGVGASHITETAGNAKNARVAGIYTVSHGRWQNSVTLAYLTEQYTIVGLPQTSTQLVYPTFETHYTNADHPLNPERGISFSIQASGADEHLLSESTFAQITGYFKSLYTIDATQTRLLFRTEAGHTVINNLINLPLSLQLLAGGSHSVRGFNYNSLGPGKNMVIGSFELQQRIKGKIYGVGFIDTAAIGNNNIFQQMNTGVGPGLAWIGSIGMIELTVANAFTQPNKPWVIQFAMGAPL